MFLKSIRSFRIEIRNIFLFVVVLTFHANCFARATQLGDNSHLNSDQLLCADSSKKVALKNEDSSEIDECDLFIQRSESGRP